MNIELEQNRKLEDVEQDFNRAFPYLKLEFTIKSKLAHKQIDNQLLANRITLTIGDLNKAIIPCSVEITGTMTVFELERLFTSKIDLPVRILRKSGNIWMGTSFTNNWTLAQQNEHGREISTLRIS